MQISDEQPRPKQAMFFLCLFILVTVTRVPLAEDRDQNKRTRPPSVVLITLDTVRADHVGDPKLTPFLAALGSRGALFNNAISVAPLTLPAHATLLTGLLPSAHGAVDNGTSSLASNIPTLASVLAGNGYQTAAVIGSRVLDRRFGLDHGFQWYDDRMTAEDLGEHGYPERTADEVTSSALQWLASADRERPLFLWVHYYDAHAPYSPPPPWQTTIGDAYSGEIAFVDDQIRRLLTDGGLEPSAETLVAVVGDHGESLGDHGEDQHGIFLYGATLEVPLIIAGGGVPAGRSIDNTVAIRRLAATMLDLVGVADRSEFPGPPLPISEKRGKRHEAEPVFSFTRMPQSAYGWSRLRAVTSDGWRYIEAPQSELYDLKSDPKELVNLADEKTELVTRMRLLLHAADPGDDKISTKSPVLDPEISEALIQLGYLSGMSESESGGDGVDPKDGILFLDDFRQAKMYLDRGQTATALASLQGLVKVNPGNVPFQTQLARAYLASGDAETAISTYRAAININPTLDFLHTNLARVELELGRLSNAQSAFEKAIELNPRFADAWLGLAEIAARQGDPLRERQLLEQAEEEDTCSAVIEIRLAQIALRERDFEAASHLLRTATTRAPQAPLGWMLLGESEVSQKRFSEAADAFRQAAALPGVEFPAGLALARVLERKGDLAGALQAAVDALEQTNDPSREAQARAIIDRLEARSPQSP